jgi:hypothetical protein
LTSDAGAERRRVWQALADHALIDQRQTRQGMRLTYSAAAGVEDKLRELVDLETECCAFADWQVETQSSQVVLEVTAPADAVSSLQAMFA